MRQRGRPAAATASFFTARHLLLLLLRAGRHFLPGGRLPFEMTQLVSHFSKPGRSLFIPTLQSHVPAEQRAALLPVFANPYHGLLRPAHCGPLCTIVDETPQRPRHLSTSLQWREEKQKKRKRALQ